MKNLFFKMIENLFKIKKKFNVGPHGVFNQIIFYL